jgi:aldose 1-epimerase
LKYNKTGDNNMSKIKFGTTKDGQEVYRYILTNKNHMEAHLTNYGAILLDLLVPDKQGKCSRCCVGI